MPAVLGAVDTDKENAIGNVALTITTPWSRDLGFGASCGTSFLFVFVLDPRIAVQLAEQGIAILGGPVGEVVDKVLDLPTSGFFQGFCAAEVDGIGLDQVGIKPVLTDKLAEAIANTRAAVSVASAVAV